MTVDKNKHKSPIAALSEAYQEKEISLDGSLSENPHRFEDNSSVFDEIIEKPQTSALSETHQEKEILLDAPFSDDPCWVEDNSLDCDENQKKIQASALPEAHQEIEISIDESSSDSPHWIEDNALDFDANQIKIQASALPEAHQEIEISIDESSSDSPHWVEDNALAFDENIAKLQMAKSSEERLEKEISTCEASFASRIEQEGMPAEIFSPKPDTNSIRAEKQGRSVLPIPVPALNDRQLKTSLENRAINKPNIRIIGVGGAKGGVGRSVISANLAVSLALLGHKVVLADLDFGSANVHLYTGVNSLVKTWNDFLNKKVDSITDILTSTAFKGLKLIGGDASKLGSANLPYLWKLKIIRHLKTLETDFLIVDLGGDTAYNELDFFLLADEKIVLAGTDPASVLDSQAFIKVVFSRFLERFFSKHKSLKDMAVLMREGSLEKSKNFCLDYIFQEVRNRDFQASIELKKQFDQFSLSIVLNMTESSKDVRIAKSIQDLAKDKFFLDIGILGTIPFDQAVRKAARNFIPVVVENPRCQASRNIHRMVAAIILRSKQETTSESFKL